MEPIDPTRPTRGSLESMLDSAQKMQHACPERLTTSSYGRYYIFSLGFCVITPLLLQECRTCRRRLGGQQLLVLLQGMQQQQEKIQQAQLKKQHAQLQQQFEHLRLGEPAPPPPLPGTASEEALSLLVAHPLLSDQDKLYARLLQATFPVTLSEQDSDLVGLCYTKLAQRVEAVKADLPTAPNTPRSGAAQASENCFYVSKEGRRFGTSLPPPYPCRRRQTYHWSCFACPPASSQRPATP